MHNRLSYVALVISAVAMLIVLFTPSPKAAVDDSAAEVERIALRVSSESEAAAEEYGRLQDAFENIEGLRGSFAARAAAPADAPTRYAEQATVKEIQHRWREFEQRLKVLNSIRAKQNK